MSLDTLNRMDVGGDRVFILTPIEGYDPKTSKGLVDNRLFSGENRLHAIKDNQTGLWYLKYEKGGVPEEFKQHFTQFSILLKFITDYYKKRNLNLKEVPLD